MLTEKERREFKRALEQEFVIIRNNATAAFDAECICLCAKLDKLCHQPTLAGLGSDLRDFKKQVRIDLDLHAVEILSALHRISEGTYGRCVECREDLTYDELRVNPAQRFCSRCCIEREMLRSN